MRKLRLWVVVLIIWLIFIFNIERINSPINIRSYTYIFVALAAILALAIPRTRRLSYLTVLFIPAPSFLLFNVIWRGQTVVGEALPLTVTQVSAIVLTSLITRQISYGLRDLEQLINTITSGYVGKLPKTFEEAEGPIYTEVRRARRHHRPLSVIALKVEPESIKAALPKVIQQIQQAMMNEYVLAGVTQVLDENVPDYGAIALRNNHFIIVLPETTEKEAPLLAQSLQKTVQEKTEVKLLAGTASFPTEGVTFETLIELAVQNAEHTKAQPAQINLVTEQSETVVVSSAINGSNPSYHS
jgi:GGDEF domain-containing protein